MNSEELHEEIQAVLSAINLDDLRNLQLKLRRIMTTEPCSLATMAAGFLLAFIEVALAVRDSSSDDDLADVCQIGYVLLQKIVEESEPEWRTN